MVPVLKMRTKSLKRQFGCENSSSVLLAGCAVIHHTIGHCWMSCHYPIYFWLTVQSNAYSGFFILMDSKTQSDSTLQLCLWLMTVVLPVNGAARFMITIIVNTRRCECEMICILQWYPRCSARWDMCTGDEHDAASLLLSWSRNWFQNVH
jgi:hypothetical protein